MGRSGSRGLVPLCFLTAVVSLASCGGGEKKQATTPPVAPAPGPGGTVGAQPTHGQLGPAETVGPGGATVTGRPGPISPKAQKPTQSQLHGVAGGVACASTTATPSRSNLRPMSRAILCLLNNERAARGQAPLRLNGRLARASKGMAVLMVRKRFFAHDTPDGRTLLDRVRPTGYVKGNWQLGENLAWGSGGLSTPRSIVNGWMNSPGHKANILHAAFRDIGIGIRIGPPSQSVSGGATYVTDFGRHG
jgi:uncharacterized protein YkwD